MNAVCGLGRKFLYAERNKDKNHHPSKNAEQPVRTMTSFGNIKVFDHDVLSIACRTTGNNPTPFSTRCSAIARGFDLIQLRACLPLNASPARTSRHCDLSNSSIRCSSPWFPNCRDKLGPVLVRPQLCQNRCTQTASACRIRFVIASGCEISARWLASISIVFAPIRLAMKRSRSGLIVRSWVDTA